MIGEFITAFLKYTNMECDFFIKYFERKEITTPLSLLPDRRDATVTNVCWLRNHEYIL